jgi:hypothetical protein
MSKEKKQSEWLGKPSTRKEREDHEALGDRKAQARADLEWASMSGGSPASRRAAAEQLAEIDGVWPHWVSR